MKKTSIVVVSTAVFIIIMITMMIIRMQKDPIDPEKRLAPGVTDEPTFHTTSGIKHFFENIDITSMIISVDEENKSDSVEIKDESTYKKISEMFSRKDFNQINDDSTIKVPYITINLYYNEKDASLIDCITITDQCIQTLENDRYVCDDMQKFYKDLMKLFKMCKKND